MATDISSIKNDIYTLNCSLLDAKKISNEAK
jgi:hypothetical protein